MNHFFKKSLGVHPSNVGAYITADMYAQLVTQYQDRYAGDNSFVIPKALIQKVLNASDAVVGIRFMYGLDDPMNPASVRVLLVPCTCTHEGQQNASPMVTDRGYYDQYGTCHSLTRIAEMMADYVKHMKKIDNSLVYKQVTRGNYMGKNSLRELVKDENCANVRLYWGLEGDIINAVFEPLDAALDSFGIYMDFCEPCPPLCDDPKTPSCIASMAVELHSTEEELNTYRQFRDEHLLKLEGGAMLYELYYFISPLVASIVDKSPNRNETLHMLYNDNIVPFNRLVAENRLQEAADLLHETLLAWSVTYNVEMAL